MLGELDTEALNVIVVLLPAGNVKPLPAPFTVIVSPDAMLASEFSNLVIEMPSAGNLVSISFIFAVKSKFISFVFSTSVAKLIVFSISVIDAIILAAAGLLGVRQVPAIIVPPPPSSIAVLTPTLLAFQKVVSGAD